MGLPANLKVNRSDIKKVTLTLNLTDGESVKHDFFIRRLSMAEMSTVGIVESQSDFEEARKAKGHMIAMALVEADGVTPVCTPEEAGELDPSVGAKLCELIRMHQVRGNVKTV